MFTVTLNDKILYIQYYIYVYAFHRITVPQNISSYNYYGDRTNYNSININ